MAIVAGDILKKLSVKTGEAGNSTAGTPAGSLGKYISTTELSGTSLNNLFDDVSGAENEASDVEYRCLFIHNAHGSLTLQGAVIYIYSEVSGGTAVALGVDTTAASAIGSSSAELEVADESTAPAGVSFSTSCVSLATALSMGNIAAGQCKAVWVKRTAAKTAAVAADGMVLRVSGGTAANMAVHTDTYTATGSHSYTAPSAVLTVECWGSGGGGGGSESRWWWRWWCLRQEASRRNQRGRLYHRRRCRWGW